MELAARKSLRPHVNRTDTIKLHLSEVKGPVMDRLEKTHFLDALTGQVFLSQYDAWIKLAPVSNEKHMQAVEITSACGSK